MKNKRKVYLKENGITLVALVVTVVVLLILAGVTITYVLGDHGIFKLAQEAKNKTENAMAKEQEEIGDLVDWLDEEMNGPKPINKETSYVGYYADMDGNGSVDGIIYADLAVGGEGMWNSDDWSNYQYSAVSDGLKEYYVREEKYIGKFYTEAKEVVVPVKGSRGTDRFYIMALEDVKDEATGNTFCWYDAAYDDGGKLDKIVATDANDFERGKENTNYVMEKWETGEWGEKDANGTYKDLWGAIKVEVSKGWFLPSKAEWSAFGDMLYTKCGVTTENYNQTFGLSDWYWSSSQNDAGYAYRANFYYGCMDGWFVNGSLYVRLSATF